MGEEYECPICGKVCDGKRGFSGHFRGAHPDEDYSKFKDQVTPKKTEKEVINKWLKKNPRQKAKKKLQRLKEKAKR